jgi:hypothetical protein
MTYRLLQMLVLPIGSRRERHATSEARSPVWADDRAGRITRSSSHAASGQQAIVRRMRTSLYHLLAVPAADAAAVGRTEGTKTTETIDNDRDLTLAGIAVQSGRRVSGAGSGSLYRELAAVVQSEADPGRTKKTAKKETLDGDAEAIAAEPGLLGDGSLYRLLSQRLSPGPSIRGRTDFTRVTRETIDNDQDAASLAMISGG